MRILNHPNVVNLLEVIDTEETVFIVIEFLRGADLFTLKDAKDRGGGPRPVLPAGLGSAELLASLCGSRGLEAGQPPP